MLGQCRTISTVSSEFWSKMKPILPSFRPARCMSVYMAIDLTANRGCVNVPATRSLARPPSSETPHDQGERNIVVHKIT